MDVVFLNHTWEGDALVISIIFLVLYRFVINDSIKELILYEEGMGLVKKGVIRFFHRYFFYLSFLIFMTPQQYGLLNAEAFWQRLAVVLVLAASLISSAATVITLPVKHKSG